MSSRRRARIAVPAIMAAGAVLLSGLAAPETAGAQPVEQVDVTLAYTCEAGAQPVSLAVSATFPASAVVGQQIEPAEAVLRLSAPPAALADLGAVTAGAVIRMDTAVTQAGTTVDATWTAVHDVPVAAPAEGADWVFEAPADVPPLAVGTAGPVSITAGALTVTVTGYTEDGSVTDPPSAELACTPDADQPTALATVEVSAPVRTPGKVTPPPGAIEVGPGGGGTQAAPPAAAAAEIPKECHKYDGVAPEFRNWFCTYMTGYANVAKLNASVLQPPGIQNVATTSFSTKCDYIPDLPDIPGILCFRAKTLPDFEGKPQLPPAPGSFYAFGFVPVTGTMQLTQLEPSDVKAWSTSRLPITGLTTVEVKLSAQILDTTVNGVPLPVGDDCRTSAPIEATFTGDYDHYSITKGGVLTGEIAIPSFSGCGVTEDLDAILSGLISGSGNYVKLTQGAVCYFLTGTGFCPPPVPEPQR